MNERWYIRSKKADFAAISKKFNITPVFARILRNRDLITDEQINEFLYGTVSDMHDPYLLDDMDTAVSLINAAVRDKKKIRIIGDYDADGVCASYILETGLRYIGADADVRIPDRMEDGYGINCRMIDEAAACGVSLIVTCDNGIAAHGECLYAAKNNISVIITDHHEPNRKLGLPEASAVIDQKRADSNYPYRELCGAAIAYKVIQALLKNLHSDKEESCSDSNLLNQLLIFAGIATITDIVPLTGENRIFVKEGLKRLSLCDNPGLNALIKVRELDPARVTVTSVGFVLGPCINSAGRLKSADLALELFETNDLNRAVQLANELSNLNESRKNLTEIHLLKALNYIEDNLKKDSPSDKVLVIYLPEAHESIAGIIAGRLKELYCRPAIVITDSGGKLKGSCRSTDAYNIIEALAVHPELFEKFGGHAKAAGFTLSGSDICAVKELSELLNLDCAISDEDLIPKVWADMQLPFEFVSEQLIREISLLEPTGTDNPAALFAERNISVISLRIVGRKRNGLKLRLKGEKGTIFDAIMFKNPDEVEEIFTGLNVIRKNSGSFPAVSILYYPQINEFRGLRTVQLKIESVKIPDA